MKLEGFSGYEIFPEEGKVWSYKRNKFIGVKNKYGYIVTALQDDNKVSHFWSLHRLIWTVVNGEIPKEMEINHLDENPSNNSISNLSLVTRKENINWGTRNERASKTRVKKYGKSVVALKDSVPKMFFPSTLICKKFGFSHSCVAACCRGERKTHKGYEWRFQEEYPTEWLYN